MSRGPLRRAARRSGLLACVCVGLAAPQSLRVYSEFQRIDPFGHIVAVDRGAEEVSPREILSPALVRNGYSSFHIALSAPAGAPFHLYLGQNPDGALKIAVYRERYVRRGGAWIPDALIPVELPYTGRLPDPQSGVPGRTVTSFWMDLWVAQDAPVRRVKVEPQLSVGDRWVTYPMEVRVIAGRIPAVTAAIGATPLPPVESSADAAAVAVLQHVLCGPVGHDPSQPAPSVRSLIRRNARQDLALARAIAKQTGADPLAPFVLQLAGVPDREAWCRVPGLPRRLGAEAYLRIRDFLYRTAQPLTLE